MQQVLGDGIVPVIDPLEIDPVLVVGNGPVGQSLALLLARWGLRVTLVDARSERDPIGSKALCQARDVLDVWDAVGAGKQIRDEGTAWSTVRTFYQDHEISCWQIQDSGASIFPPIVNIGQQRTEEILDLQINATEAIDVRWGYEFVSLSQDNDRVSATFNTPDGVTTLTSPYVAIATGSRCDGVRAALGLSFEGETFLDYFLICDIRTSMPGWESERRFYFDPEWNPGRQVLIHPCPDSTFRIDWQVPPDFDLDAEEASGGLDARIRKVIGDQPYEIVWHSVYKFHSRHVDRMQLGRVSVLGDAAHIVSPFGARGLNTGIYDAENIAWKIAFHARGWADQSLLESYHDERLAATKENIDVTTATMNFLVPHGDDAWAARRAMLEAAATDPELARNVDSGRLSEPYWYVDSPIVLSDPRRPFAGRPPKGHTPPAAPGVLVPDIPLTMNGEQVRIRELARTGMTYLVGAGVNADDVRAAAASATAAPVCVLVAEDVDASGWIAKSIGVAPGEVWIIRPDAHISAVVDLAHVASGTMYALGR